MADAQRRTVELAVAAGLAGLGVVVAGDSLRHDIGWNATGPGPGYFPFRVGVLIVLVSALLAAQVARRRSPEPFASSAALQHSFSVFWPTAALVVAMFFLGCYVPSLAYLVWMMRAHGRWTWLRAGVSAIVIVVVIFMVFERWFEVPLAKGPIEDWLGLY